MSDRVHAINHVHVAKAQPIIDSIAAGPAVFMVYPHMFHCRRCGLTWKADVPMNTDLKDVTCSNCYGEYVYMTAVRVKTFEDVFRPTAAEAIDEYNALKKRRKS